MQILFDLVQFIVHVLDLGTHLAPVIKLLAAAKLIVQPPGLDTNVFILAPNATVSAVTAQLTLHMGQHPVEMIDLIPQPAAPAVELLTRVVSRIIVLLIHGRRGVLVFFVS